MSKTILYSVLKRYFYGETSKEETERVQAWLNEPENKFRADEFLKMLWNEISVNKDDNSFDQEDELRKIHQTIHILRETENLQPHHKPHFTLTMEKVIKQVARIAAILLLPVMIYLAWEVFSRKMWLESQEENVYNEIVCPLGAMSHFELPDGTTGSLNNGSRLRYPVKFQGDLREVELEGEAYFHVRENKRRPFIIKTHGLDVKVTGTRLNVYSYSEDNYQEFTLESGSMELIKKESNRQITLATMKPGQLAVYNLSDAQINLKNQQNQQADTKKVNNDIEKLEALVSGMDSDDRITYETNDGELEFQYMKNPAKYTSWKDGKLVLRNDPMPLLLKRIERWYHVDFRVIDEGINEYTYWATFEQENLNQVLELLSLTGPVRFKKHPKGKDEDGVYKPQVIDVMLKK